MRTYKVSLVTVRLASVCDSLGAFRRAEHGDRNNPVHGLLRQLLSKFGDRAHGDHAALAVAAEDVLLALAGLGLGLDFIDHVLDSNLGRVAHGRGIVHGEPGNPGDVLRRGWPGEVEVEGRASRTIPLAPVLSRLGSELLQCCGLRRSGRQLSRRAGVDEVQGRASRLGRDARGPESQN